jgi:hypothetical protein
MKDGWEPDGRWVGGLGGERRRVKWLEGVKKIGLRSRRLGMKGRGWEVCLCMVVWRFEVLMCGGGVRG